MLAYAAHRRPEGRAASPRTLTLIVAGHAAVLALVITARNELPPPRQFTDTQIDFIDPVKPPPIPPKPLDDPKPSHRSQFDQPKPLVPTNHDNGPTVIPDRLPISVDPFPPFGPIKELPVDPPPVPVERVAVRFITPADDIRPPYPASKIRLGEEASLRLALTIDPRGRVVAVDPVGAADPEFLAAASSHILKRWRYKPATEDGRAVTSRIQVTLTFKLDE